MNSNEYLGMDDRYPAYIILLGAILRNIWALFPFGYGMMGAAVFVGLIIVFLLLIALNRIIVGKIKGNWVKLYALIGLVPYVRYLAIRHHSWFHYFFTHRAQAATVMALCFIAMECLQWNKKGVSANAQPHHPDALPECNLKRNDL